MPTTCRVISSPRWLRMVMTTEYSHGLAFAGWRMVPSTCRAEELATAGPVDDSPKRKWPLHAGQIFALSRILDRQWGQMRLLPGEARRAVLMPPNALLLRPFCG